MSRPDHVLLNSATFICGHPKSGTSLLASLLDSHSQLIVYPEETLFFRYLMPRLQALSLQEQTSEVERWILRIFHWETSMPHPSQVDYPDRDYSYVDYEQVRIAYERIFHTTKEALTDHLPSAILAYGQVTGAMVHNPVRWVEKSPYNENFSDIIYSRWPDAKCVHIVRDPRDNYASYVRKHPDWTPAVFSKSWSGSITRGCRNLKRYSDRRYLIIQYEQLVREPEKTINEVADFLGIEPSAGMLKPTRAGRSWAGNSMFGEVFESISDRAVGRYLSTLPADSISSLEKLLYPECKRLGYKIRYPINWRDRINWLGVRARWLYTWWHQSQ